MAKLKMFNTAKRTGKTPGAKGPLATPSHGKPVNGTTNMPASLHPQSHAAFMNLGNKSA